jgi:hypothetical protein
MTTAELRAATRQYDEPTVGNKLPGRPLTKAQREHFESLRGRGRPTVGQGAKVISLSVERQLLAQADARARALGISRAELVARGLRTVLAKKPHKSKAA